MPTAAPTFTWIDAWATIPASDSAKANGRTHGVCSAADGRVLVFHQAHDALLTFDPDGALMSAVGGARWRGAHGMTLVREGGEEYLWLVDQDTKEVAKTDLVGTVVQTIGQPDHPAYRGGGRYVPTWAAQNPHNGEIWVADGYGSWLVHRFDRRGGYVGSLDGTEGHGRFQEPHGLNVRVVGDDVELWITDRANHRTVVYDGDGRFLRQSGVAHSPSCYGFHGDLVVVPELFTGVKLLDARTLALVTEIGANPDVGPRADGGWWPPVCPQGWPDLKGTDKVRAGTFNSPHGACFTPDGDVIVVEWIVGGRITKLARER